MTLTYLNFLLLFVIAPSILLFLLLRRHLTQRWWLSTAALCLIALIWTTPWDNYLVATGVWWYDDAMIVGIVLGYVPIEEYSFFILQTVMTSLLLVGVMRWLGQPAHPFQPRSPALALWVLIPLAILIIVALLLQDRRLNYLLLEVGWLAFIPFAAQYLWGFDILLHYWRVWFTTTGLATLWLASMDMLAIQQKTWHISETQTTGIKIAGILPIEELIFFLITNLLIVQGMLLFLSPESWQRASSLRQSRTVEPSSGAV